MRRRTGRRRGERGQAMIEYSIIMWVLLAGAAGVGLPFMVWMLNALDTYYQSIYYMLGQPL
jgi:hypothetical protein